MAGKAQVTHKINRCWRFLSNKKLHDSELWIYQSVVSPILSPLNELLIAVDWSGCCRSDMHLLRASLVHSGRSIPLYNEVHPQSDLTTEKVHQQFLIHLKEILPKEKRVIIITDAGFKTSWFNRVNELGWYFVGRVSSPVNYRLDTDKKWHTIKTLRGLVKRGTTVYLGIGRLGQDTKSRMRTLLTAYWGERKDVKILNHTILLKNKDF